MGKKSLRRHPFYIRSTLLIEASEWKTLHSSFYALREKYNIPVSRELKWADVWSLRHLQLNDIPIKDSNPLKNFEHLKYTDLIEFVGSSLALINNLNDKCIIVTYTKNRESRQADEKRMLGMHLQELIQRTEMELQKENTNLGVLFFDPVSKEKNEYFRELYFDLFENGDYIEKYSHIKDSLNIENSHHSVGIQIADYISGAFSSLLKSSSGANYNSGVSMYFDAIHPNLRSADSGQIMGFGIREVPRNPTLRRWLENHIAQAQQH